MAARYTIEELVILRESPLVKKPDGLPSIELWLDQSAQDQQQQQQQQGQQPNQQPGQQRKARNQNGAREDSNSNSNNGNSGQMGNFAAQRPSLLQTRHTSRSTAAGSGTSDLKHLSRVATNLVRTLQADGLLEDIVLGPPKTSFASSRNLARLASDGDKLTSTSEDAHDDDTPAPAPARSRFFQDGAASANKNTTPLKSDRAVWRTGRGTGEEEDQQRNGERSERHNGRRERNLDSQEEPGARRNGYGGQRSTDQRWSRDTADRPLGSKIGGDGQRGGWRERERARQQEHNNNNHHQHGGSGNAHLEREPEWMDEPVAKEDSMPQMKTVEDFEKWKESMKKKSAPATADSTRDDALARDMAATPVKSSNASNTPATPVAPDTGFDKIFGTWGQSRPLESPAADPAQKQPKAPSTAKGKSSRFASMFAPKDEPRLFEEAPASPSVFQQAAANGSSEDKEGFARIMAMLGKPTMSPGPDPSRAAASPAQSGAGMAALFGAAAAPRPQQTSRPPTYSQSSPIDPIAAFVDKKPSSTTRPESGLGLEAFMSPQPQQDKAAFFPGPRGSNPASNVASPNPSHMRSETGSQPRFPFIDQPPQQRQMQQTPETVNVQQIVAGERAQKPPGGALNKDSEFLLNLINQAKNNRSAGQQNQPINQHHHQQSQGHVQHAKNDESFQLFLDQPPSGLPRKATQPALETHAPKPQQPHRAPGALEEQLMQKGIPQMNMGPQNERGVDQPQPRGQQQRVPPGFFEDPAILQHQAHLHHQQQQQMQAGRRQSHALPQGQGLPEHLAFPGPLPPGFPMSAPPPQQGGDRMPQPPPGFNPNMRHPPGFAGIPGIFQPPQQTGNPGERPQPQGVRGGEFPGMMPGPGGLAQMQGHAPQGPPPQGLPQGLMGGPPPPGFMGMNMPPGPPPPGFFNGMPPPPGFPGMPGMMSPPGLMTGGPGMRGPVDGPMQGLRSPIEQMQGMPPGFGGQAQQRR